MCNDESLNLTLFINIKNIYNETKDLFYNEPLLSIEKIPGIHYSDSYYSLIRIGFREILEELLYCIGIDHDLMKSIHYDFNNNSMERYHNLLSDVLLCELHPIRIIIDNVVEIINIAIEEHFVQSNGYYVSTPKGSSDIQSIEDGELFTIKDDPFNYLYIRRNFSEETFCFLVILTYKIINYIIDSFPEISSKLLISNNSHISVECVSDLHHSGKKLPLFDICEVYKLDLLFSHNLQ